MALIFSFEDTTDSGWTPRFPVEEPATTATVEGRKCMVCGGSGATQLLSGSDAPEGVTACVCQACSCAVCHYERTSGVEADAERRTQAVELARHAAASVASWRRGSKVRGADNWTRPGRPRPRPLTHAEDRDVAHAPMPVPYESPWFEEATPTPTQAALTRLDHAAWTIRAQVQKALITCTIGSLSVAVAALIS